MPSAEPSTPDADVGDPASSSMPWIVPSSPNGPCSTGKTTSTAPTRVARHFDAVDAAARPGVASAMLSSAAVAPSALPRAQQAHRVAAASQRPSRVMPTGTTSYFAGSSARITDVADASDTACSSDCAAEQHGHADAPLAGAVLRCVISCVTCDSRCPIN